MTTVIESKGEKIEAFCKAIEGIDRFSIIALAKDNTVFVIEDSQKEEDELGHQIEIDVEEVISAPLSSIIAVLNGRNDIVVKGYTRIVGYYSGISNWNKSKIGELRDRANGQYGTGGFTYKNQDERLSYIDKH
jgi:hypothetical protein|tara:strand:+ start:45 stop:443 length:399 start_codon:yes stop_codon:yes gene_type:complete